MSDPKPTPRGIRNNNPGNIRHNIHFQWVGELSPDPDGYSVFDIAENGIRAMAMTLRHYSAYHHCLTLREYISRWAPPSTNPTANYVAFMSRHLLIAPGELLDLDTDLPGLITGIITFENGEQPYATDTIARAVARSLIH